MSSVPDAIKGVRPVTKTNQQPPEQQRGLAAESVGQLGALFQSISFMAPGAAIVFSLGIAVPLAGEALPVSVLIAGLACILAAVAIGQLACRIPSAGGLYSYVAVGLGPKSGFMVAWLNVGAAVFFPAFLFILFGWYAENTLERAGIASPPWWALTLIAVVLVFCLTYFGVRLSAKALIVLGGAEVVVLLALSTTMIVSAPNSAAPFNPSNAPSMGGLIQAAVFGVLAFTGFEAASTLGEEAKNPRRVINISIIGSAVLVGALYIYCTYAWNVGTGFDIVGHYENSGGNAWNDLGKQYWGGGWVVISLALLNSIIANSIAAVNNCGRVLYAMARAGSAPSRLGHIHDRYKTPDKAILLVISVGVAVALLTGAAFGADAAWGVNATIFTIFAVCIYILASAACIQYFTRGEGKDNFNILLHVIIPVAAIIAFSLPLYAQYFDLAALFAGQPFRMAITYPIFWANWAAILWIAAGIALTVILTVRRSSALSGHDKFIEHSTRLSQ